MLYIKYKYNKDIKFLRKVLFKNSNNVKLEELNNKKIKIKNYKDEQVIKKIIGIEVIPVYKYKTKLDYLATGNFYSTTEGTIDHNSLKRDLNCYDNNLIILTLN